MVFSSSRELAALLAVYQPSRTRNSLEYGIVFDPHEVATYYYVSNYLK